MRKYHSQASTHTFPPTVKPGPALDVRDEWRRQVAADEDLGAGALRVALVLLNFANRSGFTSVGVARLGAELGGKDRRSVQRGLAQLVKAGHLERDAGQGLPGRGGWTSGTRLIHKGAASGAATSPFKVAASDDQRGGVGRSKGAASGAAQTLLTNVTPAADAPGLEAGSATAKTDDTGSAPAVFGVAPSTLWPAGTAGPGGEVLRLLGELEASRRSEPRPVRDAVLAAIRQKLGAPPKRAVSDDENSAPAGAWGGYGERAPKAK